MQTISKILNLVSFLFYIMGLVKLFKWNIMVFWKKHHYALTLVNIILYK